MFRHGVAGPEGCTPLHSNTFAPDEGCLAVGVKVLTLCLLRWGQRQRDSVTDPDGGHPAPPLP